MTVLEAHDLTIGYPQVKVAQGLRFALQPGELVCLIGPNGAGKSTLIRTIAAMQKPLTGQVRLMGDDVHQLKPLDLARRLSIVLTERPNTGLLSGYALVALGRHPYTDWSGRLTEHDEAVVRWAVDAVDARELAVRPVAELSDGQRQKIMIARALAQEPDLMILDEPTAFLDLPRRAEIMRLLKQLTRTTNRTILLSTHDLDLALRTADRIWLLTAKGQLHVGAPEDLILNGVFERAFRSEGVEFDPYTGSFKVNPQQTGTVALTGTGDDITLIWTRRALEREGFVINASSPVKVTVQVGNDAPCWHMNAQSYPTIEALIAALRASLPQVPSHP